MGSIEERCRLSIFKPVISPTCYQDESPMGYLIRLAEINGYNTYRRLIVIGGLITYNKILSHIEACNILKDLSWTGFHEVIKDNKIYHYPIENLSLNSIRYCSLCLKENNYFRLVWQMKTAFICLKHQVWLMDTCPSCKRDIKYSIGLLGKCSCGVELMYQPVIKAPKNVNVLQHYLFGNKLDTTALVKNSFIQDLNLTITERTDYCLFILRWLPQAIIQIRDSHIRTKFTLDQLREQIIVFADMCIQGASGFWCLIDQLNKLDKKYRLENQLGNLVFIKFYQLFYKKFTDDKFLPFKVLIEKYIKKFWKKQLTNRNILFSLSLIKNHPWIPIDQAVKEFKISPLEIRWAIKDKLITILEEQKVTRKYILLYKPSIELNIKEIKDKLSFKQAIQIQGITKKQLNQLIIERHFPKAIPPKKDYSSQWLFSLIDISKYLKELLDVHVDIEEETVTIAQAMRIIGSRIENPLPKLLNKIRTQEIAVVQCNNYNNIKALAVSKKELNNWIQATNYSDKYFTIPQIAKILNISQQLAYQLVNKRLISCFEDKDIRKRLITKEDPILNFVYLPFRGGESFCHQIL
ncbi:TniQ family protein [Gilliamella sp. ESL0405]|uniref:TniQ family protein n=1 Tax=Gilliamella sp. ESL0405 TaxID=2704653 RepID=UPI001C6A221B|nr:TniQ family protein [Gilliamella sp. ESL0405]QYN46400.1 hypothetical protein GYM74_03925 [Gilliamella sp. ESL0405]